jgi:AraC family transcriptional regulator
MMPAATPVAAVLDVPPEQVVLSSEGRGWTGIAAAEILHPHDDFAVPTLPCHVLVFNLGTPIMATERRTGRAGSLTDGGVMILPAGRPRDWHVDHGGEVRHLHLYLDPALVRDVAAEADLNPDRLDLLDAFGASDPHLAHAGMALLAELHGREPGGRIYAEALATMLGVQLLRHHSSARGATLRGPARLAPSVLRRVTAYIEDHLAEDLALDAVARVAHLSPYHFARLFKVATGAAPHQYIIGRRVERARLLLATTGWPLSFIAQEVGFASGSHLAFHFRRRLGVSPTAYR